MPKIDGPDSLGNEIEHRLTKLSKASYKGCDYEIEAKGKGTDLTIYYAYVEGVKVGGPFQSATEAGKCAKDYIDAGPA